VIVSAMLAACGSGDQADSQPVGTPAPGAGDQASDGDTASSDGGEGEPTGQQADTDTNSDPGDDPDTDAVGDTGGDDDGDDPDSVVITDIDNIPAECRQIMSDFLREIEPIVAGIEWETATVASLQQFEESFDEPSVRLEQALASSGCDEYDFGPDETNGLEFSLALARREAPGVVGYLEFIRDLFQEFDPEDGGDDPDLPTDCDGAIAFVSDVVEQTDNLSDLPVSEYVNITAVLNTIQFNCPPEQVQAFYEGPLFAARVAG
jgi:hypothetical protein